MQLQVENTVTSRDSVTPQWTVELCAEPVGSLAAMAADKRAGGRVASRLSD